MKKITDERLKLQNLKNIRILFLVQNIGIIGILGYDLVTKGLEGMTENPLWFVFMITMVVSLYLSMSISVEHETNSKHPKKGLNISILILVIISAVIGIFVSITDGFNVRDGLIMGGILFICGLIPVIYLYYLRKRRSEENDN
ncbi:hypothetical protein SPD48_03830 [Pseudogracilibacillus sp. SE30717A]|uniref:hypothetical protein n=1 Tax=Pseudogracilibacillus sp. SE30717A TaxID=3098293 RepID=UPI00300E3EBB